MVEKSKYLKMVLTTVYVIVVGFLTLLVIDHFTSFRGEREGLVGVPELKAPPEDILYSRAYFNANGKEEVKYAYKTDPVPTDEGEDVSMRTSNSRTYPIRTFYDEKGEFKKEVKTSFFSGLPQMYKEGEEWLQIEYATTTPEKLVASGAPFHIRKRELIEWFLPGKPVFAATATYYPNPDAETSSVDGYVFNNIDDDWTGTQGGTTGTAVADNGTTFDVDAHASVFYAVYYHIYRGFLLFDTSAMPDNASISAATLDVYISAKSNLDDDGSDTINLVTSTPASNTSLSTADFDQVGTTLQAAALDITSITTSADNTFTLNSTGRGNIALTGVTKFALREGHDLANTAPDVGTYNSVTVYAAEQSGTTNDPTLTLTYVVDTTAPTPNPATFGTAPTNVSESYIYMVSTVGSDADGSTPISYLFTEAAGSCGANHGTGGTTSSWQTAADHADTGLQSNKCYSYTVQMRDSLSNTGTVSSASMTYTSAATPGAVAVSSITGTTAIINNAENGNPASNPTTNFAVYVSATSPNDSTWNGKYVNSSGAPSATAVWLTDAQLTNLTLTGLTENTLYSIASKARNNDSDETSYGATTNFSTTLSESPNQVRLKDGIRLKDGVRLYYQTQPKQCMSPFLDELTYSQYLWCPVRRVDSSVAIL